MIEQSDSDRETSGCPNPPVFSPERVNCPDQPNANNEAIIPVDAPDVSSSNIHSVDFYDAIVAPSYSSVVDFHSPDEPDPEHICQRKQIW